MDFLRDIQIFVVRREIIAPDSEEGVVPVNRVC
jgi:hypothetical protein